MPAPAAKLNKVGFSPRQAAALQDLAGATLRSLAVAGFTAAQARLLKTGAYDVDTNATGYTLTSLIKKGRFTRAQAQLVLATS